MSERESWLETHHFATFLVLVAAGIALTTVGIRSPYRLTPLEKAGLTVTSPFARSGAAFSRSVSDAWAGLSSLGEAHDELVAARREIRDLRVAVDRLEELSAENDRLRRLLGLKARVPRDGVPALVIHRLQAPDQVLVINKGTGDGVTEDLSVVAPGGVVGKVLSATRHAAKVQCLTDPDAGLAVLVGAQRQQVDAVVRDTQDGLMRLRHFELLARFEPGDAVVTSGLDQVHPKGLRVGTVEHVVERGGAVREVLVRPAVEIGQVEEVLVLLPAERGPSGAAS